MAKAVELLGLRACLTQSTMDSGDGLPALWAAQTTDDCIQVNMLLGTFNVSMIFPVLHGTFANSLDT